MAPTAVTTTTITAPIVSTSKGKIDRGFTGTVAENGAQVSLTENRLGKRASPLLITHVNKVELDDELVSLEEYVLTDLAHAVMLTRLGIFKPQHGRDMVQALLALHSGDTLDMLSPDPEVGTLGLQIERYLERTLGPYGRDIQRARSRIDQKATNWRLINRASLTTVADEVIHLASQLLTTASKYAGALMPGYTHLQHSQPTTIDHYLNGHYWAISQNLSRLLQVHDRLNLNPLGGAAYSGTSWPISRPLTTTYLGFSAPLPSARTCGLPTTDLAAELATVLALTLASLSSLASDLYLWSSSMTHQGTPVVTLPGSLCGTSSMMPQKRNPIALERIRGLAAAAAGWPASQLAVLHTASSTDADQAYVHNLFPGQCEEAVGAVALLREVLEGLEFDVQGMQREAVRGWATASALADFLVREAENDGEGLSWREAHEEVARLIRSHEDEGVVDGKLIRDLLPKEGVVAKYSVEVLQEALDPDVFVQTRISEGGTAPHAREELRTAAERDLAVVRESWQERKQSVQSGREQLLRDADDIVAGCFGDTDLS